MPNWCANNAEFNNDDVAEVAKLEAHLKYLDEKDKTDNIEAGLFGYFVPRPPEFDEGESWYGWNCENWGTKWDINSPQYSLDGPTMDDVTFLTAWAPPIPVFERMKQLGYTVKADYWDEGGWFVGIWNDGEDRCCSDLDNAPDDMTHLVAHFNYPEDDEPSDLEADIEAESTTYEAATNAQ